MAELLIDDEPRVRQVLERAEATQRKEKRRQGNALLSARFGILIVALVGWELAAGRLLDPYFFSQPSRIWDAFSQLVSSGRLADNLWYTVQEAVAGYVCGALAAVVAAAVLGSLPRLYAIVEPFLLAIYSVPSVALGPLMIVWFGIGMAPKVILAAYFVFFIVFMNGVSGVRGVKRGWIDTARVMGASRFQLYTKIVLRGAAPQLVAGLRIAVPQAVIGAIVGEFISSQRGMGFLILDASSRYQASGVFAAIIVLSALVLIMVASLQLGAVKDARKLTT